MGEAEYEVDANELATVTNGGLSTSDLWYDPETRLVNAQKIENDLGTIYDFVQARNFIATFSMFREYLEHQIRSFKRNFDQFCWLEAKMWMQIARIPGYEDTDALDDSERVICDWILGKTQDELDLLLERCLSGHRLDDLRLGECRMLSKAKMERRRESEYKRISAVIEDEFKTTGKTQNNIGRFVELWDKSIPGGPDMEIAKSCVEGRRDWLLHNDGVGLGDGDGTYVSMSSGDKKAITDAITTRVNSILCDIRSLAKICRKYHKKVPKTGIKKLVEAVQELG